MMISESDVFITTDRVLKPLDNLSYKAWVYWVSETITMMMRMTLAVTMLLISMPSSPLTGFTGSESDHDGDGDDTSNDDDTHSIVTDQC